MISYGECCRFGADAKQDSALQKLKRSETWGWESEMDGCRRTEISETIFTLTMWRILALKMKVEVDMGVNKVKQLIYLFFICFIEFHEGYPFTLIKPSIDGAQWSHFICLKILSKIKSSETVNYKSKCNLKICTWIWDLLLMKLQIHTLFNLSTFDVIHKQSVCIWLIFGLGNL